MNTNDLEKTAIFAYLAMNAMKSLLEKEGYDLDKVKTSMQVNAQDGSFETDEYCIGELCQKANAEFQSIIEDKEHVLVPKKPTQEMLDVAWECPPIHSGLTRRKLFEESLAIVYRNMIEASQGQA